MNSKSEIFLSDLPIKKQKLNEQVNSRFRELEIRKIIFILFQSGLHVPRNNPTFARRIFSICLSAAIIARGNSIIARLISENSRGRVSNPFSVLNRNASWRIDRGREDLSVPHFRLAPVQGLVCPRARVDAPAYARRCNCSPQQMYICAYVRRVPRHASLRQWINSIPADKSTIAVLSETRRSAYPAIGRPQFNHASLELVLPSGKTRMNAGRNFNVGQSQQARMTKRTGKNSN